MNIEEYISSGILELYVLGELSEEDKAEVESIAQTYPEVKEELALIEKSLELYARNFSKAPRTEVKKNIFNQIENSITDTTNDFSALDSELSKNTSSSAISNQPVTIYKKTNSSKYLIAASWFLVALFASTTIYYWSKWKSSEQNLIALQTESEEFTTNFNEVKNSYEGKLNLLENYVALINDEKTKTISLAGLPLSPKSKAKVIWNANLKKVYLTELNLPPPPVGKQYQLWALYNKKPIDAGVVENSVEEFQLMKEIASADAFAITLEKEGGSPSPHLEELYVMGNI